MNKVFKVLYKEYCQFMADGKQEHADKVFNYLAMNYPAQLRTLGFDGDERRGEE